MHTNLKMQHRNSLKPRISVSAIYKPLKPPTIKKTTEKVCLTLLIRNQLETPIFRIPNIVVVVVVEIAVNEISH